MDDVFFIIMYSMQELEVYVALYNTYSLVIILRLLHVHAYITLKYRNTSKQIINYVQYVIDRHNKFPSSSYLYKKNVALCQSTFTNIFKFTSHNIVRLYSQISFDCKHFIVCCSREAEDEQVLGKILQLYSLNSTKDQENNIFVCFRKLLFILCL